MDDTLRIANALREGEWNTMWGKVRFAGAKTWGLPTVLEAPLYFSKVQGGKVVTFESIKATAP